MMKNPEDCKKVHRSIEGPVRARIFEVPNCWKCMEVFYCPHVKGLDLHFGFMLPLSAKV